MLTLVTEAFRSAQAAAIGPPTRFHPVTSTCAAKLAPAPSR